MPDLVDIVPPAVLLRCADGGTDGALLLDALLRCTAANSRYWREVVQVWMSLRPRAGDVRRPDDADRALDDGHLTWCADQLLATTLPPCEADDHLVGRVLEEMAARRLARWPVAVLKPVPPEVEVRLQAVVRECANEATMDKHGDRMLHTLLKLVLPAAWVAALAGGTPYRALNAVHGARANTLVGKWVATPLAELAESVEYGSAAGSGLVVVAGLLAEVLDNVPATVAISSEALAATAPSLVVLADFSDTRTPDVMGVAWNGTLLVAPPVRPVATVVAWWASRLRDASLHTALVSPGQLPPGAKLKQWLA